jgi:hypothetical protein
MVAAGFTYLIGSSTRFLAPGYVPVIAPIYAIALVSEVSLCLWLLVRGVQVEQWERVAGVASTTEVS